MRVNHRGPDTASLFLGANSNASPRQSLRRRIAERPRHASRAAHRRMSPCTAFRAFRKRVSSQPLPAKSLTIAWSRLPRPVGFAGRWAVVARPVFFRRICHGGANADRGSRTGADSRGTRQRAHQADHDRRPAGARLRARREHCCHQRRAHRVGQRVRTSGHRNEHVRHYQDTFSSSLDEQATDGA